MNYLKYFWVLISVTLGIQQSFAQLWTQAYTSPTAQGNCAGLTASLSSEFSVSPVITRTKYPSINPFRGVKFLTYMPPGRLTGNADIYYCEKGGTSADGSNPGYARILYYNGADSTLMVAGTFRYVTTNLGGVAEVGLVGIALNRLTFAQDNTIYIFYAYGTDAQKSDNSGFRLARVKIDPVTHLIDTSTKTIILKIPAGMSGRWHTGGPMRFDENGDLYMSIGDNEAAAQGPDNTKDLRGAILRIHPDTTAPKGYTIPKGNFGEYFANYWDAQGHPALAAKYRDTAIVRPELYIKGTRNDYGLATDFTHPGIVAYAQCGPDAQKGEVGPIYGTPGFGGWQFWVGRTQHQLAPAASYDEANDATSSNYSTFNPSSENPDFPVNHLATMGGGTLGIVGVDSLPPVITTDQYAYYNTNEGCTCATAIIDYDYNRRHNPGAMPPHLNNTVIQHDCGRNSYYMAKYDTVTGKAIKATSGTTYGQGTEVWTSGNYTRGSGTDPRIGLSVDMEYGADGYMYFLNYTMCCCDGNRSPSTFEGLSRMKYTGTCVDTGLNLTYIHQGPQVERKDVNWMHMGAKSFIVYSSGPHAVKIMDLQGRTVYSLKGEGRHEYALPTNLSRNTLYYLQVKTDQGMAVRGFLNQ